MENDFCFFENRNCKYYPCHKELKEINCMFCYCPFYTLQNCPGNPVYIKRQGQRIKKCTDCTFPHKRENYSKIISRLKEELQPHNFFGDYVHGGEHSKKIRYDFSVNTNPLGLPPKVKSVIKKDVSLCEVYPDRHSTKLKSALASKININQKNIIIGNGASDLITLIARWLGYNRKIKALVLSPTFSGYERALKGCGIEVKYYGLKKENNFELRNDFISSIKDDLDAIFLCNPNNPTSTIINEELLKEIIDTCKSKEILLVIDECFMDFVSEKKKSSAIQFISNYPNLIVLNAFTKTYCMPGIRLGYAICSDINLIASLEFLQSEWNVSSLAIEAGITALKQTKYLEKSLCIIEKERVFLNKNLALLGVKVFPSVANFILLETNENIFDKVLEKGILVRDCSNFKNLDGNFIRISICNRRKNRKLISTLKEILNKND